MQFRHTPTHRGSLPSISLTIEMYVGSSRSRDVGFGGTYSIEQSCSACQAGPLSCLDHPHPRAPCATLAIQPLQAPERLARLEHLVELDVRCGCERTRTLIENRSTTVDVRNERGYNPYYVTEGRTATLLFL